MPQALHNLASVKVNENDTERAKELLERLLQVQPDAAGNYSMLASVSVRERDYETAAQHLEKAVALEQDAVRRADYERRLKEIRDYLDKTKQNQTGIRRP